MLNLFRFQLLCDHRINNNIMTRDIINSFYLHLSSQMIHSDALMREFLFSRLCFSLRRTGEFPLSASQFEELVIVDAGCGSTVLDGQQLQEPWVLILKLYECSLQAQLHLFQFIGGYMFNVTTGPDTTFSIFPMITSKYDNACTFLQVCTVSFLWGGGIHVTQRLPEMKAITNLNKGLFIVFVFLFFFITEHWIWI